MSKPEELRQLADKFSEGWHEGIKIDAMDVMLLSDAASELETMQAILAQQPAAGEPVVQAGLTDDQLREAFAEKLSDIDPSEHDMTIFALGAEVGAGELAAERQMARMYFDERNSARDAWRRAADERDQLKATTEPVHQIRKAFSQDAEWAWRDATEEAFHMHPEKHRRILYTRPAPSVPADVVRVPLQVMKDASEALGNFVSDHGWGDADMQAMDNLDAYIARHEANRAAMLAAK